MSLNQFNEIFRVFRINQSFVQAAKASKNSYFVHILPHKNKTNIGRQQEVSDHYLVSDLD